MKLELTEEQLKEVLSGLTDEEINKLRNTQEKSTKDILPKIGSDCYWIDCTGDINSDSFEGYESYHCMSGFSTKEEAEYELEYRKFKRKFIDWKKQNDKSELDWNDEYTCKYRMIFNLSDKKLQTEYSRYLMYAESWKYLSSQKLCEQATEYFGEENIKKHYVGVNQPY